MPIIAIRRLLREKYPKHLLSYFEKTKPKRYKLKNQSLLTEVKKNKQELELMKSVDCFLDGYGNYKNKLVSFKMKSL